MEFAVACHDRKTIGKRSRNDDSVGGVFVEVRQRGGAYHDVVRWQNGGKAVLLPEVCNKARLVRTCRGDTASGVLPQRGVIGEKVALDGNFRAISGERTYLSGSLDWHDSRYGAPIS